ncbi:hypothetical protein EB796_020020 [Bugula neritina]|uniref:Uncharacterized protein n=1 Tax=Bugula neritina TaxID=10212 RepID=A0A7J7J8J1_BUGNE|nr:hypothetical protein EB796_020020 [Bugula neritina]
MTSDIEALDEGEYADAEGLDAAASDSNALNAQEAANTEREAFIDAQSLNARSGAFSDNFFDDGNFGGASFQPTNSLGFFGGGSGDFFRRRRR